MLGILFNLSFSKLWESRASGLGDPNWAVGIIEDIEVLDEAKSAKDYLLDNLLVNGIPISKINSAI